MRDLELAWDTFEFHNTSTINEEVELTNHLFDFNNFLDKGELISTQEGYKKLTMQRNNIVNKIITSSNVLINTYVKQNTSLEDLIIIYRYHSLHGVALPPEREVPTRYLLELKNTNATLIEEIKVQREKYKSLLLDF